MRIWLIIVLAWPLTLAAETYRWTDDNGKVHFSDKPPEQAGETETLEIEGPKPLGQDGNVKAINERMERMREVRSQEEAAEARKAERERRARARQCEKKRHSLDTLTGGPVLYRDKDGNTSAVSKERMQRDIRNLKAWIEKHCSNF